MPDRHDQAWIEHWQILQAIKHRDATLAESLMRSHIQRAAQNLTRHIGEQDSRPLPHLDVA
jgi:DNA-binding GntR family transcriptional regulator